MRRSMDIRNMPLQELDMELEVLKRQREMLQEERHMLEERKQLEILQRQYNNYNSQQPKQGAYNQYSEFSSAYVEPATASNFGNQRGYKRPANNGGSWQNTPKPKRFAPLVSPQQGRSNFAPPKSVQPQKQRPAYNLNQNSGFRGNASNVPQGRAKQNFVNNKPRSVPSYLKKSLDRDVGPVVLPPPKLQKSRTNWSDVLQPGKEISPQVRGRLELVLGNIVKDIRNTFQDPPHSFDFTAQDLRIMKERVRDQIYKLMLGKTVNAVPDIMASYRKVYPESKDIDLVKSLQEDAKHLNEAPRSGVVAQKKTEKATVSTVAPKNETGKSLKVKDTELQEALSKKMDEIFEKLIKAYEAEYGENSYRQYGDVGRGMKSQIANNEVSTGSVMKQSDVTQEPAKADGEKLEVDTDSEQRELTAEEKAANAFEKLYESRLAKHLQRNVQHQLPKFKNLILSIVCMDEKISHLLKGLPTEEERGELHFVKIYGKPSLPKKPVMHRFLAQFHPGSVRKHKVIYNLLFVEVRGLHNYKNLLAMHNYTIGGCKLYIKENNFLNGKKSPKSDSQDVQVVETKDEPITIDDEADAAKKKQTDEVAAEETDVEDANNRGDDAQNVSLDEGLDCHINNLLETIEKATEDEENISASEEVKSEESSTNGKVESANTANVKVQSEEPASDEVNVADVVIEKVEILDPANDEGGSQPDGVASDENIENIGRVGEKKTPDTPTRNVVTRRSSRIPQKN